MRNILLLIIAFTLCLPALTNAQEQDSVPTYKIGLRTGVGFIIPHNRRMSFVAYQHIGKREIYLEKNTFGQQAWHHRYGFPKMGLSLTYYQLNNSRHLGNAFSFAPYVNFALLNRRKLDLHLRTALGGGYLEKPFDVESNHKNTAIGSKFNLYFSISFEANIDLYKNIGISFGASFSHFSNTAFQKPNLGINIPTIESGLYYRLGKKRQLILKEEDKLKNRQSSWVLTTGGGMNQTLRTVDKKHFANALLIGREKQVNYKSSIGASLDLFHNPGRRKSAALDSINIRKGFENIQFGLSLYHVLHMGRLNVIAQTGYYIRSKDKDVGNIYQMIGGRIKVNHRWNGFFALKTHLARAEYLLVGISYQLKNEK